jgi:hypothetical protein
MFKDFPMLWQRAESCSIMVMKKNLQKFQMSDFVDGSDLSVCESEKEPTN